MSAPKYQPNEKARDPLAHNRNRLPENEECTDALVPGVSPLIYSRDDFDRIAAFVDTHTGIVFGDRKQMVAYTRLVPLLRASGHSAFCEFLDTLDHNRDAAAKVISALTTNHTYFWREPRHFDHFARELRCDLIERAKGKETVRIWSAGCSSGEEIWSLLMVLLGEDRQAGERIANSNFKAHACDVSGEVVESARKAVYPEDSLDAVPPSLRQNWCAAPDGHNKDHISIAPELRDLVEFQQLNLLSQWPFTHLFDLILCRNVMIYFDTAAKERLLLRLARQLRPGGMLYIGHSERVTGDAKALLDPVEPTIYRRNDR